LFLAAVDDGMSRLTRAVDDSVVGIDDPLDRIARMVRAYLAFFADNAHYVELLILERAEFRDRKKPTYFAHRDANQAEHIPMLDALTAAGRFRDVPVERIMTVFSDLVYGTMFTNHFVRRRRPIDEQAADILDVMFLGLLSDAERQRLRRKGEGPRP